ncbi:hypothetical protein PM082_017280 [Marasmius tenuissimus]|nr:hypothetical protein PM082_017280 [Marasmius tenuissimus]
MVNDQNCNDLIVRLGCAKHVLLSFPLSEPRTSYRISFQPPSPCTTTPLVGAFLCIVVRAEAEEHWWFPGVLSSPLLGL